MTSTSKLLGIFVILAAALLVKTLAFPTSDCAT